MQFSLTAFIRCCGVNPPDEAMVTMSIFGSVSAHEIQPIIPPDLNGKAGSPVNSSIERPRSGSMSDWIGSRTATTSLDRLMTHNRPHVNLLARLENQLRAIFSTSPAYASMQGAHGAPCITKNDGVCGKNSDFPHDFIGCIKNTAWSMLQAARAIAVRAGPRVPPVCCRSSAESLRRRESARIR